MTIRIAYSPNTPTGLGPVLFNHEGAMDECHLRSYLAAAAINLVLPEGLYEAFIEACVGDRSQVYNHTILVTAKALEPLPLAEDATPDDVAAKLRELGTARDIVRVVGRYGDTVLIPPSAIRAI